MSGISSGVLSNSDKRSSKNVKLDQAKRDLHEFSNFNVLLKLVGVKQSKSIPSKIQENKLYTKLKTLSIEETLKFFRAIHNDSILSDLKHKHLLNLFSDLIMKFNQIFNEEDEKENNRNEEINSALSFIRAIASEQISKIFIGKILVSLLRLEVIKTTTLLMILEIPEISYRITEGKEEEYLKIFFSIPKNNRFLLPPKYILNPEYQVKYLNTFVEDIKKIPDNCIIDVNGFVYYEQASKNRILPNENVSDFFHTPKITNVEMSEITLKCDTSVSNINLCSRIIQKSGNYQILFIDSKNKIFLSKTVILDPVKYSIPAAVESFNDLNFIKSGTRDSKSFDVSTNLNSSSINTKGEDIPINTFTDFSREGGQISEDNRIMDTDIFFYRNYLSKNTQNILDFEEKKQHQKACIFHESHPYYQESDYEHENINTWCKKPLIPCCYLQSLLDVYQSKKNVHIIIEPRNCCPICVEKLEEFRNSKHPEVRKKILRFCKITSNDVLDESKMVRDVVFERMKMSKLLPKELELSLYKGFLSTAKNEFFAQILKTHPNISFLFENRKKGGVKDFMKAVRMKYELASSEFCNYNDTKLRRFILKYFRLTQVTCEDRKSIINGDPYTAFLFCKNYYISQNCDSKTNSKGFEIFQIQKSDQIEILNNIYQCENIMKSIHILARLDSAYISEVYVQPPDLNHPISYIINAYHRGFQAPDIHKINASKILSFHECFLFSKIFITGNSYIMHKIFQSLSYLTIYQKTALVIFSQNKTLLEYSIHFFLKSSINETLEKVIKKNPSKVSLLCFFYLGGSLAQKTSKVFVSCIYHNCVRVNIATTDDFLKCHTIYTKFCTSVLSLTEKKQILYICKQLLNHKFENSSVNETRIDLKNRLLYFISTVCISILSEVGVSEFMFKKSGLVPLSDAERNFVRVKDFSKVNDVEKRET